MTVPVKTPVQTDIMESVIAKGDLARLDPGERVRYYNEVCRSMGLNPLTQPFSYITLNGKLTLYATRACADQLRKVNGVSLEIISREIADDILTVHVRAKMPDGRVDEDLGSVSFPSTLKGEARANAELKAVTKAKRRATLSVCGLGWLDETEVADIPAAAKRPAPPAANVMLPLHDAQTGEILDEASPPMGSPAAEKAAPAASPNDPAGAADGHSSEFIEGLDGMLAEAAEKGTVALKNAWDTVPNTARKILKAAMDKRHKPRAEAADKAAETTS